MLTVERAPLRLLGSRLSTLSALVAELRGLREELCLTKRDPMSRLERRIREKATPLARDVLRARRERKARNREHALGNVIPPRKVLSTKFRHR